MAGKEDWGWRAGFLNHQANAFDKKAEELKTEAARYRGLAEQASYLSRIGDGEGWLAIDTAPKGKPVQVIAVEEGHHWLPFTACLEIDRWTRPASRDGLPFVPTHWRELPSSPRA